MSSISSKLRLAIAPLAAATAALTLGLASAPADAAIGSMSAKLGVAKNQRSYHSIDVTGVVKMSQSEAQTLIRNGYKVQWRLWGEDTFSDDFLHGPDPAGLLATSRGLEFHGAAVVLSSVLNEDWGEDEVYAGVRLLKPNNATLRSSETNRVRGYF